MVSEDQNELGEKRIGGVPLLSGMLDHELYSIATLNPYEVTDIEAVQLRIEEGSCDNN